MEKNGEFFSINGKLGFLFQSEDLEKEKLALPPEKEAAGFEDNAKKSSGRAWVFLPL